MIIRGWCKYASPASFYRNMVLSIIIGLMVWFVLPLLFENSIKKKHHKKALRMCCKICGIAIVVMAIISDLL